MGHIVSFPQIMHTAAITVHPVTQTGETLSGWYALLIQRDAIKSGHARILKGKRPVLGIAH